MTLIHPFVMNGRNVTCSSCKVKFELRVLFMSNCGHFYCTICAAYMIQKERREPLECCECLQIIETGDLPAIFMRPV